MFRDDWVAVVPVRGEEARVAAELLALAQHPGHVRTQGNGLDFIVPPYLAELYTKPPAPPAPKRRRINKGEGEE